MVTVTAHRSNGQEDLNLSQMTLNSATGQIGRTKTSRQTSLLGKIIGVPLKTAGPVPIILQSAVRVCISRQGTPNGDMLLPLRRVYLAVMCVSIFILLK
jgi:hypothetical protein